jgi:hypothetical protein
MMLPSMGAFLEADESQWDRIDANPPVEVSVVIPCVTEANSRAFCVDKALDPFRASGLSGGVIVAGIGGTDASIQIAEEHSARVVRSPKRTYGSALRAGTAAARGPLTIGDADQSYDFGEVRRFADRFDLLRRQR